MFISSSQVFDEVILSNEQPILDELPFVDQAVSSLLLSFCKFLVFIAKTKFPFIDVI